MPASRIACPNCRTGFKTESALVAGQKIKCPKCGGYFAVPAPSTPRRVQRPVRRRQDSGVQEARAGSKKGVLLFVLILLLLAGVIGVVIWHFASTNENQQASEGQPAAATPSRKGEPKETAKPTVTKYQHVLVTSGTNVTELPEPVASAVNKKFPGAVIGKVDQLKNSKDLITGYRLGITYDKSQKELDVTPEGKIFGER